MAQQQTTKNKQTNYNRKYRLSCRRIFFTIHTLHTSLSASYSKDIALHTIHVCKFSLFKSERELCERINSLNKVPVHCRTLFSHMQSVVCITTALFCIYSRTTYVYYLFLIERIIFNYVRRFFTFCCFSKYPPKTKCDSFAIRLDHEITIVSNNMNNEKRTHKICPDSDS